MDLLHSGNHRPLAALLRVSTHAATFTAPGAPPLEIAPWSSAPEEKEHLGVKGRVQGSGEHQMTTAASPASSSMFL